jgi:hypothetical protein
MIRSTFALNEANWAANIHKFFGECQYEWKHSDSNFQIKKFAMKYEFASMENQLLCVGMKACTPYVLTEYETREMCSIDSWLTKANVKKPAIEAQT